MEAAYVIAANVPIVPAEPGRSPRIPVRNAPVETNPHAALSALSPARDLMFPGHRYNPRTGTGIEWLPPDVEAGAPGKVRLWARGQHGRPAVAAEAEHDSASPWDYWYNLAFSRSFPRVTHWWFGDAWTGHVRIWGPEGAGTDPETGAPLLSGWMRFGSPEPDRSGDTLENTEHGTGHDTGHDTEHDDSSPPFPLLPALPWSVLLTDPLRVTTPLPTMFAGMSNLPLQLLLAEGVIDVLRGLADRRYRERIGARPADEGRVSLQQGAGIFVTSVVRKEDLHRAFSASFDSWTLDRLVGLTRREALCRAQGIEVPGSHAPASA